MSDLTRLPASLLREKIAAKKVLSGRAHRDRAGARGVFHNSRSPVPGVSFSFDGEGVAHRHLASCVQATGRAVVRALDGVRQRWTTLGTEERKASRIIPAGLLSADPQCICYGLRAGEMGARFPPHEKRKGWDRDDAFVPWSAALQ